MIKWFILIFCLPIATAFTAGVSPHKIHFGDAEALLILTTDVNTNFEIRGCDFSFLEIMRNGSLDYQRELTIRYDSSQNTGITNCTLQIFFMNKSFSPALSVPVSFPYTFGIIENSEEDFLLFPIILATVICIIAISLIIKYG
jgi:hypothetical protein